MTALYFYVFYMLLLFLLLYSQTEWGKSGFPSFLSIADRIPVVVYEAHLVFCLLLPFKCMMTVNPCSTYKGVFPFLFWNPSVFQPVNWEKLLSSLEVDRSVGEVEWAQPGTSAGMAMLESFIDQRLRFFATHRNNPNCDALSHLSPWLHTGQFALCLYVCFSFVYAIKVNGFQFLIDAVKGAVCKL